MVVVETDAVKVLTPEKASAPGVPNNEEMPTQEDGEEEKKPVQKPDEHIQRPEGDIILTVLVKRLVFFGIAGKEISILHEDAIVDRITTDSRGQALFKLPAGDYTVVMGDKKIPITLQKHATLRM